MDPLEFIHEHVHDLILLHFEVHELEKLSLVSRRWNRSIGNSPVAMKRVWWNFDNRLRRKKKKNIQAFQASDRKYQNFRIRENDSGLKFLLLSRCTWRRAQIQNQSLTSYKDYLNLLRVFNETIIELDLGDVEIKTSDFLEKLKFKRLKKLGFYLGSHESSLAVQPFMQNIKTLQHVVFHVSADFATASEQMTEILALQPQLTHLQLSADAFEKTFLNIDAYNFQLNYFSLEYSGNGQDAKSKNLLANLAQFLSNQKKLDWIILGSWTSTFILEILFKHLSMRRLSLEHDLNDEKFDLAAVKLPVNDRIKQIDFECGNPTLQWLQPVIDAAPKVEVLYFQHITPEILEFVLKIKTLKTLKYGSEFEGFPKFIKKLENNTIDIVEYNLLDIRREMDV